MQFLFTARPLAGWQRNSFGDDITSRGMVTAPNVVNCCGLQLAWPWGTKDKERGRKHLIK